MIISAAPFRVSFLGGGSDIGVFYRRHRGAVLSATISKYLYISIHPYFNAHQTLLKYAKNELVDAVDEIQHPIFKAALTELLPTGGVEITSTADVPSGTGLGSSSTFTVALYHALYAYNGVFCSKEKLARKACELEIERLREPIGKQDQYAAAYGGLNFIEFNADGSVAVAPLILDPQTLGTLEQGLMLFFIGHQREARQILQDQCEQIAGDEQRFNDLVRMTDLAYEARDHLIDRDLLGFARAMHKSWMLKRTLSGRISNSEIDGLYERALENGAVGGKLLGAGGTGFLLLYCPVENQHRLRVAMNGCFELPFSFDWTGSRIIHVGEQFSSKGFMV